MIEFIIDREYMDKQTNGKLKIFGSNSRNGVSESLYLPRPSIGTLETIEPVWDGNKKNISCIPEGTYQIRTHVSPKFKKCILVMDVDERSNILFHAGNTVEDTTGCIIPGINISGFTVENSFVILNMLIAMLVMYGDSDANGNKTGKLTIRG